MAAAGWPVSRSTRCSSTEVLSLAALLIGVAGVAAIVWGAQLIGTEVRKTREEAARAHTLAIAQMFAPAVNAAHTDPRSVLVWQPLARTARALFPDEFAALDRAAGSTFPLSTDRIQAAHSQWTADWLAWEAAHDAEYKQRAAAETDRGRLDLIERQKLETYQRRYEEYIRVARAIQALLDR